MSIHGNVMSMMSLPFVICYIKTQGARMTRITLSNLFIKLMSQSPVQKPGLKPQTASNADVEAQWLGKAP
jgi:hypothetical protein